MFIVLTTKSDGERNGAAFFVVTLQFAQSASTLSTNRGNRRDMSEVLASAVAIVTK